MHSFCNTRPCREKRPSKGRQGSQASSVVFVFLVDESNERRGIAEGHFCCSMAYFLARSSLYASLVLSERSAGSKLNRPTRPANRSASVCSSVSAWLDAS